MQQLNNYTFCVSATKTTESEKQSDHNSTFQTQASRLQPLSDLQPAETGTPGATSELISQTSQTAHEAPGYDESAVGVAVAADGAVGVAAGVGSAVGVGSGVG